MATSRPEPCPLCGGDGYIEHARLEVAGGGAAMVTPCPNGCYLTKTPRDVESVRSAADAQE